MNSTNSTQGTKALHLGLFSFSFAFWQGFLNKHRYRGTNFGHISSERATHNSFKNDTRVTVCIQSCSGTIVYINVIRNRSDIITLFQHLPAPPAASLFAMLSISACKEPSQHWPTVDRNHIWSDTPQHPASSLGLFALLCPSILSWQSRHVPIHWGKEYYQVPSRLK